jgi:hypothetical protein
MEVEEAITGILRYREAIHKQKQWNDPVGLSDTMTKLAVYNAYLADNLAGLHHDATQLQQQAYKNAREADNTIADSEATAKITSLDTRTQYERVKYIYQANSNLISVLQSRLRVIENQLMKEGI